MSTWSAGARARRQAVARAYVYTILIYIIQVINNYARARGPRRAPRTRDVLHE
eukprot:SAG31_NODE_767_length_12232_cov_6.917827_1_plen_53_part_00